MVPTWGWGVGGGEWGVGSGSECPASAVGCRVSGTDAARSDAGSAPTPHPLHPTPYFGRMIALIAASTFSVRFDVPPVVSSAGPSLMIALWPCFCHQCPT